MADRNLQELGRRVYEELDFTAEDIAHNEKLEHDPVLVALNDAYNLGAESRATEGQGFDPWEALCRHGHEHYSMPVWSDGKFRCYSGPMGHEAITADTAREAALDLCRKLGLLPKGPNDE